MSNDNRYSETHYIVRDASGEYLKSPNGDRTPASDEAYEFETPEDARKNCQRATDEVYTIVQFAA